MVKKGKQSIGRIDIQGSSLIIPPTGATHRNGDTDKKQRRKHTLENYYSAITSE